MHELALLCLSLSIGVHLSTYSNTKIDERIFVIFLTGEFPKSYSHISVLVTVKQ